MRQLQVAGRYRGRIVASKVDKSRNGCAEFVARLGLDAEWQDDSGSWSVFEAAGITAYLTLTTLRHQLNIRQVESVMDALGWDGRSLSVLHNTDWSDREVEVIVEDDTNEKGEPRLVVAWLNPVGGLRPTSAEVLDELDEQWRLIGASGSRAS